MLNFITKGITKVFGSKSERDLKKITPLVALINEEYNKLNSISDDELRAKTVALKEIIKSDLKSFEDQIAENKAKAEKVDVNAKELLYVEIDKITKKRDEALEVTLEKILPQAFAVVKETARRLKENKQLVVKATGHDIEYAAKYPNVVIDGDKAIWKNQWIAAGTEITWEMLHYDVQLIGGIALHKGNVSEMATGEGKTLVATLPAYLNAIAGYGVHVVTVNDYLAKRDSEWMGPLFQFHGISIDCIDKYESHSEGRKQAYLADITYGTNNEFGFDYLRDNMARSEDELVQRKLHYAMVDEVDSVLIDDARTPLIISGPVGKSDEQEFYDLKPRIFKLVEAQKKLAQDLLNTAKKLISEGNEKEGGLALFRTYRALPTYKPLIKYLSENGIKVILQKTENFYLQENGKQMPEADKPLYFTIEEKNNSVDLTEKGIEYITSQGEDASFFVLPDIGSAIAAIDKNKALSDHEIVEAKEALMKDYSVKSQRIHTVIQLLKAYTLFEKDVDYIIVENKVMIVDEQTGRVMEGRRYSDGLHQALEAKENVKVEEATQTYATVTLQNYFRMYHKLAGMTGTAITEAGELWDIYKLDVITIPTNRTIARKDLNDKVYRTVREKYNAIIDEIVEMVNQGRPVLVGTTSVENSEIISRMLKLRNIKHQVLNAKLHQKEADIVAEAGKPGTVTIATNMAGRGTDIKLTPEAKAAGGLAIVGTERHESRRVDRQLRGRAGRQGDPGSSQFFVSLEDNLMRMFGSDRLAKVMDRMGLKEGEVIQDSLVTNSIERIQRKVEENNFAIRKRLLEYDNVMNSQREVIYTRRRNALMGEKISIDIQNSIYDICYNVVENYKGIRPFDDLKVAIHASLGMFTDLTEDEFNKLSKDQITTKLYQEASKALDEKINAIRQQTYPTFLEINKNRGDQVVNVLVPFTDGEKSLNIPVPLKKAIEENSDALGTSLQKGISIALIDQGWKEHLREMDDLKQSVHNAAYEQKDPLIVYKFESYELFSKFLNKINVDIVSFLMKSGIVVSQPQEIKDADKQVVQQPKLSEQKEAVTSALDNRSANSNERSVPEPEVRNEPVRVAKTPGRNDRVSVQYANGEIKKDVKFKQVEEDFLAHKCILIED